MLKFSGVNAESLLKIRWLLQNGTFCVQKKFLPHSIGFCPTIGEYIDYKIKKN